MEFKKFPELSRSALLALAVLGLAVLGLAVLGLSGAPAAEPAAFPLAVKDFADGWRWRDFEGKENQLPGNVSVLGYDSVDDIIYAGTAQGLFRYDGYRWTKLFSAEPFTDEPINRIVESVGKTLVSTARELWMVLGGLELQKIYSSPQFLWSASPAGGIFVIDLATREHLQIDRHERNRVDEGPEGIPLPGARIFDYLVDEKRLHWLATSEGLYRRDIRKGFKWQKESDLPPSWRDFPCRRLFLVKFPPLQKGPASPSAESARPQFQLWANFEEAAGKPAVLARRREAGGWAMVALPSGGLPATDLIRDASGNYYCVAEGGSLYFSRDGEQWQKVPQIGIGAKKLRSGLVDRFGFVWYTFYYSEASGDYPTGAGGIVRFDPESRRWEAVPVEWKQPDPNIYVLSLLEASDGSIWVGTEDGISRYHDGKTWEYPEIGKTALRNVTGLAEDVNGKIWISSANAFPGTFYFFEDTGFQYDNPEINRHPIRRIVPGRRGELWFLSSGKSANGQAYRVFRYTASRFAPSRIESFDVFYGPVNDFLQAQDGSFWMATEKGLVHTRQLPKEENGAPAPGNPNEQVFTEESGLRSSPVWALAENPSDGSIWICYPSSGSGVTRIRGRSIDHFDEQTGLKSQEVWSISATLTVTGSNIWLGTGRGVARFDGECWYHYPVGGFTPANSRVVTLLPSRAEEDSILLGTYGHGVYRFRQDDRRRPRFIRSPSFQPAREGGPPAFHWEARDFKDETPPEELLYRYRLDDGPWSAPASIKSASLKGLEPGDHSIQVEVRDQDGNVNREPAFAQFHIVSPAARTRWWAGPVVATVAAVSLASILTVMLLQLRWRRSIARFRGVFQGTPNPVLIISKKGKIIDYNGARTDLLGIENLAPPRLARLPLPLVPVLQRQEIRGAFSAALEGELGGGELREKAGDVERVLVFKTIPIRRTPAGKVQGVVFTLEDVTANSRRREEKERQRRMAAVRELTDRIREELEGILGGIRRDLHKFEAGQGAIPKEEVEALKERTERAEKLSAALAEFSRVEPPAQTEEVSPSVMIEGILKGGNGGSFRLPGNITIDMRGQPGLWPVAVEIASIRRSFEEILRNAADAMPGGGKITIRLANRRVENGEAELAPGRYVEVSIADDGPGISQSQIERIFDPFYSTKERHRHRGLGLSVAYGAVRRHGGDIRVDSRVDSGTRVVVLLPVAGV